MDKQREKLRRLLQRRNASSLLNDTKWWELLTELQTMPVQVRIKTLTDDEVFGWSYLVPNRPQYYVEIPPMGPVLCLAVEWIEIRLEAHDENVVNHNIAVLLTKIGIRYSYNDGIYRIVGHILR